MNKLFLSVSSMALVFSAGSAFAQTTTSETQEIIVTGTRTVGVKAADSAAPIEVVGSSQLLKTGAPDLAGALSVAVPSLNIQTNGGDAAAVHVLAALRGLSPDDTLVLVNGKRRHPTSNLAVDSGSTYSGSATTDLNYIPVGAIDHIEVLTDGAAAQYGSDAIAGVVNIILKKGASGGTAVASGGANFNGEGGTGAFWVNNGFNLADKGFLNITLEERTHAFTRTGHGDERFTANDGSPLPGLTYPNSNAPLSADYPNENRVNGDPEYAIYNSFFNAGYDLGSGIQAYAFGNYSYNASQHFENYRAPNRVNGTITTGPLAGTVVYPIPLGFDPKEKFDETDYSLTGGLKGTVSGWNWDLSTTYGSNQTQVYVLNTANVSEFQTLQAASPTPITNYGTHTIYDGSFDATEWIGNLDIDRSFDIGLAGPLNIALGAEGRRDTYGIGAGEPASYYGSGTQSFFGYAPTDAGNYSRTNEAFYADVATDPFKGLHVDVAGRFEHYSDFGDTETGKVTMRYDFNPTIAVRGTLSDGFRAPTLAEEFYSGLNVGPTSVSGQLPPNSASAQSSGFKALKPEQSINYSVGLVMHPIPKLQITVDAYVIDLHDRILTSDSFQGLHPYCVPNGYTIAHAPNPVKLTCPAGQTAEDVIVAPGVLSAINGRGVTTTGLTSVGVAAFINAVSTQTSGLDVTANYSSDFDEFGHVDWTLGFNYNHTTITSVAALPAAVAASYPTLGIDQTKFLNLNGASDLTTAQPREKLILQALWTKGPWSVNLRETIYNDMLEYVNTPPLKETIGTTGITDLDIGYKITKNLKVDVGANNLFDIVPKLTPLSATGQPGDGNFVYGVPYGFAPWGQNGGYYYGRLTLTF